MTLKDAMTQVLRNLGGTQEEIQQTIDAAIAKFGPAQLEEQADSDFIARHAANGIIHQGLIQHGVITADDLDNEQLEIEKEYRKLASNN